MLSCYSAGGAVSRIKDQGDCATDGGLLVSYSYDQLERRTRALTTANGVKSVLAYGAKGELASLSLDMNDTASDAVWSYTTTRAGQLSTSSLSNSAYVWQGHVNVTREYAANAGDQYTKVGIIYPA